MEKQPVDDLFARKLREADVSVGPDVFSRLQSRMNTQPLPVRRSKAGWWYTASAACVLLALAVVYFANHLDKLSTEQPALVRIDGAKKQVNPLTDARKRKTTASAYPLPIVNVSARTHHRKTRDTHQPPPPMVPVSALAVVEPETAQSHLHKETAAVLTEVKQPTSTVPVEAAPMILVEPIARIARPTTERIVVMTIGEINAVADGGGLMPKAKEPARSNGLSVLFGKIKQLKNGDVFAKVTLPTTPPDQRSRFGRAFNGVKESLKNETTID